MPSIENKQMSQDGMVRLSCPTFCKQWLCNSWDQYKLEQGQIRVSANICVALVPSEYLHGSQPWVSPWGPTPKTWASAPSPHSPQWVWACEPILSWELLLRMISAVSSLCFAFWTCAVSLPSEVPKLTRPVRGFPSVQAFLLHYSLPGGAGPQSDIPCLPFHLYLFPYLILRGLVCLFGSLGSSASIQKMFCRSCFTCTWVFDVFVGGKVVSPFYSSINLKVSPAFLCFQDFNW